MAFGSDVEPYPDAGLQPQPRVVSHFHGQQHIPPVKGVPNALIILVDRLGYVTRGEWPPRSRGRDLLLSFPRVED